MLLRALSLLLNIIELAIFARVIISWIPVPRDNALIRMLYQITEPILAPIRALLEKSAVGRNTMFDLSPLVALLLIQPIRNMIGY